MTEINMIVGHKGAGKTTVLEIINTFGFYTTELSIQWKYLELLGFDREEKEGKWSTGVVSLVYDNLLSRISMNPIFMSGFSRPAEINFLQKKEFDCRIIEVTADLALRYQRTIKRGRGLEDQLSIEEFYKKDLRRLGQAEGYRTNDLNGLLSLAFYTIKNNGNLKRLTREVKKMLETMEYLR